MARQWGDWTEIKLDALGGYLNAFALACSRKAERTLYLDLFAGAPRNVARSDARTILGSGSRALDARPPFTKLVFGEIQQRTAAGLEKYYRANYPGRDVEVLPGDSNVTFPTRLAQLAREEREWRWAPTFAFIDQFAAEIHWTTIEALARFRNGNHKVELWLLFGESFLPRGLGVHRQDDAFAERVEKMFGTAEWNEIWQARLRGALEPGRAKHELINLMRWRLQHELGYSTTLPLQIVSHGGKPLYTLIFATDHDAGDKIMRSVFSGAQSDLDAMVARHRTRTKLRKRDTDLDMEGLFDVGDEHIPVAAIDRVHYPLDPPVPPWGWSDQIRD